MRSNSTLKHKYRVTPLQHKSEVTQFFSTKMQGSDSSSAQKGSDFTLQHKSGVTLLFTTKVD